MRLSQSALFLTALLSCAAPARAEAPQAAAIAAEQAASFSAARQAAQRRPASPRLGDQGAIDVPDGALFIPRAEGARWMRAWGDVVNSSLLGVLMPSDSDAGWWWAHVDYVAAGHVSDDEAANWNADELLKTQQEGTLAANVDRKARCFPLLETTGWVDPPRYDRTTRRLAFSLRVKRLDSPAERGWINYYTYALGREGYYSVDFIATPENAAVAGRAAAATLAAIRFDKGKGYDDFNAATDRIAGFGLAALVGGLALKKLGLLTLVGGFALKFAKIAGVAIAGASMAARRLLARRKRGDAR